MVLVRTICSRVADLGPLGGLARATHRALSRICEWSKVEEFAAWQLADVFQDGIEFGYFQEEQCRRTFGFGSGASPQSFA